MRRIGDNGPIRGLWFHDSDFMQKFVLEIKRVYQQMSLECEGDFSAISDKVLEDVSYKTSGHAILQMLKKDSGSQEGAPQYRERQNFVSLLHDELEISGGTAPDRNNVGGNQIENRVDRVANDFANNRFSNQPLIVTRESIRAALHELVDREAFLSELMSILQCIGKSK